ncbi:MAG: NAD(P)-binding protein, partial [Acidobacteriota bacterium]
MDRTLRFDAIPEPLLERSRELRDTPTSGGDFVLYWTHHALRAFENPALDVAVWAGNRLGLPVLVYQGLGAGHRFDSDRHHTFILEGARDLAGQLEERGIAYRLFAPRGRERSPLRGLAKRAALTVVEDFPAPPFPRWTERLARAADGPVWAVDAACVKPMQTYGRAFDRAFRFRDKGWRGMVARAGLGWTDVEPEVEPFEGDPGFDAVDPRGLDIADFVAGCAIDHSIGPVPHTPGGSAAGEARWRRFVDAGLGSYHRQRNDAAVAPPKGVSRLSAYFHYGMLSPLRVTREALRRGGKGAEKYLDELLVWREVAYLYAFHHRGRLESLDALPNWAQETLDRHRHDPRYDVYSWERLARGQTGDEIWDLAQRSLVIHGELHNNLRMTWGKALLRWTKSPEDALRLLVDLNHRFALDGNDPASYGGLLWCLGLFDRPFTPEQPVLGSVRGRSTSAHRKRLDLSTYAPRILRPACGARKRIAVIGAGLAGLVAGRVLQDAGHAVRLFDKGRRPGGRLSTRDVREDVLAFDHGAQYFTARHPGFRRAVDSWVEEGSVAPWRGRIVELDRGETRRRADTDERFVGVPGMNTAAAQLAHGLEVECGVRIEGVRPEGDRHRLIRTPHSTSRPWASW